MFFRLFNLIGPPSQDRITNQIRMIKLDWNVIKSLGYLTLFSPNNLKRHIKSTIAALWLFIVFVQFYCYHLMSLHHRLIAINHTNSLV